MATRILGLSALLLLCSLNRGLTQNSLATGITIDTLRCLGNEKQSYALYLPKAYTRDKKWPVILFFDPAARGSLPVQEYHNLAERFQCILIGSNNSRNGPISVTVESERALRLDIARRISVDPTNMFLSGFSGGARACTHLQLLRGDYAGIIACGASFAPGEQLTSSQASPFTELVGNRDMNFSEALETESYLSKIGYKHLLLTFEGPHTWPPALIFGQALFWQFEKRVQLPDSVRHAYIIDFKKMIRRQVDSTDIYMAWRNAVAVEGQYADSTAMALGTLSAFQKQKNDFARIVRDEERGRQDFLDRFFQLQGVRSDTAFHAGQWNDAIEKYKRLIRSHSRQEMLFGVRTVGWMVLMCSTTLRTQMQTEDWLHASMTAQIMTMLDNSVTSHVSLARTYSMRKMTSQAIKSLRKAALCGPIKESALRDHSFDPIRSDRAFTDIASHAEK